MNHPLAPLLVALTVWPALAPHARATLLTFETLPALASGLTMPQDIGDFVTAESQPSADGTYQNLYMQGNGWTPTVTVNYTTEKTGEFPTYFNSAAWPGVCALWSPSFRTGRPIGESAEGAMPAGFEYYFTFAPAPGSNRSVVVNSFVLNDRQGYFDSVAHSVAWRLALGSAQGPVIASGTASLSGGASQTILTNMIAPEPGTSEPVVLVIKRLAGTEDDLAIDDIDFDEAGFTTEAYNTGSLGAAANGLNTPGVLLNQPGAVTRTADYSSSYADGQNTTIQFLEAVNPPSESPFTIEFWARPTATDDDDAPVFNRVSDGDRSGWVFFQRNEATGWNFRMYDGNGSSVGWDLTGGRYTLGSWSHVAAVWNGTQARLYVNGALVDSSNAAGRSGTYLASTSAIFSVGSYDNGGSPVTGSVDEVAFYPTALTAAQLRAHFQAATSASATSYSSLVKSDGALIYLQQNPPAIEMAVIDGNPTVTFTGKLSQSTNLSSWTELPATSPYTLPPLGRPASLFFRAHR